MTKMPTRKTTLTSAILTSAILAGAFGLLAWSPSVHAQTAPAPQTGPAVRDRSEDNELLLSDDSVVFSASKQLEHISDSPAAVTIITADDIRRSGVTNVPDLLRSVPGVEVMAPNATLPNVSVRGFNETHSNQLLAMVDGRPIYDTAYGDIEWNTDPLLLSQIARIEVVRGPGSALYGANAFNGVVNIITKAPLDQTGQQDRATFVGAAGQQRSLFSEATGTFGNARSWAATLGVGYHSTAGFGGQNTGQVKDSDRVPILTADVQARTPRGNVRLSAADSDARADQTSQLVFADAAWHTSYVNAAYTEDKGSAPVTARVSANFYRLVGDNINFSTRTYDMEVRQQRALSAAHHLVYGVGYRAAQLSSILTGPQTHSEFLLSGYVQDDWRLARTTDLFGGLRWDHNSVYGSQVSPRLSLVHHLDETQTLRLSYATAFRAPTLLDSYTDEAFPVAPGFSEQVNGNTSVKPERISSLEAGWRRDLPHGYAGASVFEHHISGLIAFAPSVFAPSPPFPPNTPIVFQTANGNGADIAGLELEGEIRPARGLRILANYSYQNVIASHGSPADIPSHHMFNVTVQADPTRRISASLTGHYVDAMAYPGLATSGVPIQGISTTVPSYIRVDAKVGYRFGADNRYEIALTATNLFGNGHTEYPLIPSITGQPQTDVQRRTAWVMFSAGNW